MAASKPVVCADDEAFNSVVIEELNGKLFTNRRMYKKKMIDLIEHPEKVEAMSRQARISAEPHSAKYFAEKVLDVYHTALGERGEKGKTFFEKMKHVVKRGFYGK